MLAFNENSGRTGSPSSGGLGEPETPWRDCDPLQAVDGPSIDSHTSTPR